MAQVLWPASGAGAVLRPVVLAVAGTVLLALSARLQVPFWPVPMTMQPMVVLLIGVTYGSRLGAATLALYVAEGAFGLPVFAGTPERGLGVAYLMGPTGGYLLGFVLSAALVGRLAERGWDRGVGGMVAAMVLGLAVTYACGAAWLSGFVGPSRAVTAGIVPFLLGDALKVALAAALVPAVWALLGMRRS